MVLEKVVKCVVAEKFARRLNSKGEVVIQGVIMVVGKFDDRSGSRVGVDGASASGGARAAVGNAPTDVDGPKFLRLFVNENVKDEKVRNGMLLMTPKSRLILTEVMLYESSACLTGKSKMLTKVSAFQYLEEDLEAYMKPPCVSIAEAKGSPKKRRLSVEGDITEVGECVRTSTYKRRMLKVSGGGSSIDVVLWGEAAERDLAPAAKVKIFALIKEDRRLVSSSSTTFEMPDVKDACGTVIGIGDVSSGCPVQVILDDSTCLLVGESVAADLEVVELPVQIRYQSGGHGVVTSLEILNPDS